MKNRFSKSDIIKRTKKRNKVLNRILLVIVVVILVVAITFGTMFLIYQKMGKASFQSAYDNVEYHEQIEYDGKTYQFNEDVISFAFIGVDQRTMESVENTDFVGANDTNIVVAINTKSGEVNMIAIPRETVVDIDKYRKGEYLGTEKDRLALAYAYGDGRELSCMDTVYAMSRVLYNVPIEKYYALNLSGIAPINDSIGGVLLQSQCDLPQYSVKTDDIITLKGDMAESYVRARSMTDIDASLERSNRQVQYLQSFADQTFPAVLVNFGTIADLYNVGAEYSQTNMSLQDVTYMASVLLSKGTNHFDATVLEGEMKTEQDSAGEGNLHALFTPSEDELMQTILDTFYLRIR